MPHFRSSRFNLLRLSMAAIGDLIQSISCHRHIAQHLFSSSNKKIPTKNFALNFFSHVASPLGITSLSQLDPWSRSNSPAETPAPSLHPQDALQPGSSTDPDRADVQGSRAMPATALQSSDQPQEARFARSGRILPSLRRRVLTSTLRRSRGRSMKRDDDRHPLRGTGTELTGRGRTLFISGATIGCERMRAEAHCTAVE